MNAPDLVGRVVLITGASRNIGRSVAIAMAKQGADVVVHIARDRKAGEETASEVMKVGPRAAVVQGDLSSPDEAVRVVFEAAEAFHRIDYVVNNAAIRPETPFAKLTYAEWRQVFAVCLDAAFLVSQAALPYLHVSDNAAIVNIGGLSGHTGAACRAHVVAAKAGIVGLTKAMAYELSPAITVNCVSPGFIDTERKGGLNGCAHERMLRTNLVGRNGLPEEVAGAVAYLCGPSARYITGTTLHIDGGSCLP